MYIYTLDSPRVFLAAKTGFLNQIYRIYMNLGQNMKFQKFEIFAFFGQNRPFWQK